MEVLNNGQIYQLEKNKVASRCRHGKLQVRVCEGDKKFYKVKRVTCSKNEAKRELEIFIDEIENNTVKSDITFGAYSQKGLDYRKKSKSFSPNTLSENTSTLRRLNDIFGEYTLRRLDVETLKEGLIDVPYKNGKKGQTSNSYKRKLHKTMKSILQTACEDEYIHSNPVEKVPMPKDDAKEKTALTKEQFDYLQSEIANKRITGYTTAIKLISRLGLRRGEVVALSDQTMILKATQYTYNAHIKKKVMLLANQNQKQEIEFCLGVSQ